MEAAVLKRNIELKAVCPDLEAAHRAARSVGAAFSGRERQHDTYFNVARGRLKLRRRWGEDGRPAGAQLIWYRRADEDRPRPSDYLLIPLEEGDDLLAALAGALGVTVEVVKDRAIYLADEVRIHLDTVTGLGAFLEFEAIVGPAGDADARQRLDRLAAASGSPPKGSSACRTATWSKVGSRRSEVGSSPAGKSKRQVSGPSVRSSWKSVCFHSPRRSHAEDGPVRPAAGAGRLPD